MRVRYLHERHGNAGKISHSAKTTVMQGFLQFADLNSQPKGNLLTPRVQHTSSLNSQLSRALKLVVLTIRSV